MSGRAGECGRYSANVAPNGYTDDERCAGLSVDDRLLKRLADLRDDGRTPPLPSVDVQRFGYGIPAAKRTLEANGNPEPEFTSEPDRVLVTLRPVS